MLLGAHLHTPEWMKYWETVGLHILVSSHPFKISAIEERHCKEDICLASDSM